VVESQIFQKVPNGIDYVLRVFTIQSRVLIVLDILGTSTTLHPEKYLLLLRCQQAPSLINADRWKVGPFTRMDSKEVTGKRRRGLTLQFNDVTQYVDRCNQLTDSPGFRHRVRRLSMDVGRERPVSLSQRRFADLIHYAQTVLESAPARLHLALILYNLCAQSESISRRVDQSPLGRMLTKIGESQH
jgi:hypothetical protein